MMQKFRVTGMSCAACSARVEKAVQGVQGVTSCAVSLLTNSMGVEGDVSPSAIIAAVTKAGYGASVLNGETHESHNTPQVESFEEETHILLVRLIASLVLLVPLLYVSMGYSMWGLPVPDFFAGNPVGLGLLQLLLALLVMSINKKFFINGWQGLIKGAPNMDTLVALGSFAAFFWSTLQLFVLTKFQAIGISLQELATLQDFYFESAAMIVTLITVGKMLEARSKGKTTDALKNLMRLAPQTAVILRDGHEVEVAIKDVKAGDIFVVKPGAHIPVDGVVIEGVSSVNCAMLTGESMPQDIGVGDKVSAATQNLAGYLRCRAERVGEDTTLAQIIQLVSDAQATKAPVAKVADYVAGIFVPCVIGLAVVTAIIWLVCGAEMGFALARGIAVLVISCPCALGLATPVAIMVGSGLAAKSGILFKTAIALEQVGKLDIIALDKTGTVTRGTPEVTDILPYGDTSKEELIQIALSLEAKSEHPLAQAILHMGEAKGLNPSNITDFQSITGSGVAGVLNHDHVYGGNLAYIKQYVAINSQEEKIAEDLSAQGKTPLFFALEGKLCGIIACADQIKPDSREAVESLQHLGLRVVLLTGDNAKTAQAIANEAHVDEVISDVLPADKEKVIRSLKQHGCVAMVGDGINDAPALTRADLGIAIGAGADIALDAADVVLMKSKLSDVPAAIRLGRATLRNIHQNLFWAFCYNIIGIPIAAGLLYPVFGLKLSPMLGALAMSLSSFCVVSNALRLNLFNPYKADQDAPKTTWQSELREDVHKLGKKVRVLLAHVFKKEDSALEDASKSVAEAGIQSQEYQVEINGMMCENCEAHVKKALAEIEHVTDVSASHETHTACFSYSGSLDFKNLQAEVEARINKAGYQFISLKEAQKEAQKEAKKEEKTEEKTEVNTEVKSSDLSQEYQAEINGMMCENCEAHVKKALAEIEHITDVSASHETHTASFTYSGSLDFKNLQAEVEARINKAGYQFISLKEANNEAQKEAKTEAKSSDPYKAYHVEINGMMCENCEAHVKKALAEIENITNVSASNETHTASFTYSGSLDLKNLQAEVEARVTKVGYQFISLKEANNEAQKEAQKEAKSSDPYKAYQVEINGMMCENCEAHVKKALAEIEHITDITASHETHTASFTYSGSLDFKNLQAEVEARINKAGYQFIKLIKEHKMEKRLTVEGMKCPHCEAHVKEALEKIPGVTQAVADHTQNLVTVTMSQDVTEDVLKESVTQAGYIFKGMQA